MGPTPDQRDRPLKRASKEDFLFVLDSIFLKEGGAKYTDLKDDYGGKTRWGITQVTANRWGYHGSMRELSQEKATQIYYDGYWVPSGAELVYPINKEVGYELMDIAVNLSPERAAGWLQRCINCLNLRVNEDLFRFGEDLKRDGVIGRKTVGYLQAMTERDYLVLVTMLNIYQGSHYVAQALENPRQRTFLSGWVLQRVAKDLQKVYKESKVKF